METTLNSRTAEKETRAPQAAAWPVDAVCKLLELPFNDLIYRAHGVHRENFAANTVQLSTLLSIKTGGCPEDCQYCPQAARYSTGVGNEPLLSVDTVVAAAKTAKANGATRFCMGAAWRGPKERDLQKVLEFVKAVHALGLESCATLGLLKEGQADQLKDAGLDYYNHNLDTARSFTARSLPRAPTRTAWIRSTGCAMRDCACAAGESWEWEKHAGSEQV